MVGERFGQVWLGKGVIGCGWGKVWSGVVGERCDRMWLGKGVIGCGWEKV